MNIKKLLYILIGFISMGIGIIGIIVPVLPTTPFLILSSFCFVRGSEKFDAWFRETKIYKDYAEDFIREGAMTLGRKIRILLFADFMLAFPLIILDNIILKIMIVLIIFIKYYYFIFKIKTIKK